jgi:hypothetical protein
VLVTAAVSLAACGGAKPPTAPEAAATGAAPPTSLTLVRTPLGTGVQWGTTFIFDITGSVPANARFVWRFGDNSFAEGPGPASHIYGTSGSYTASVEVSSGGGTLTGSTPVTVRSLLGSWLGTVTGHTNVPRGRPPITSFTLTVFKTPNPSDRITPFGSTVSIDGLWTDNAGCRIGTGAGSAAGFLAQTLDTTALFGFDPSAVGVSIGIEQFACNGAAGFEDFPLLGTADASFDVVTGTCNLGGSGCRFRMARQ